MKKMILFLALVLITFLAPQTSASCPSADLTGDCKVDFKDFAVLASQWLNDFEELSLFTSQWLDQGIPYNIVWVDINDPGFDGHEPFIGKMSKYETTNAQYCLFLNEALASGDIYVDNGIVYGANGSNSGEDFVDEKYFETNTASSYSQITYSDGTFNVQSRDGYDMSNHPVVEVSWYGATAFCNYLGYQLPTEWQWQAVADYNESYIYGCGITIDHNKANYFNDNPLELTSNPYTTTVDYYEINGRPGPYGYGICDMAGNVMEWTSSWYTNNHFSRVFRGGNFAYTGKSCNVSGRYNDSPASTHNYLGFRVCSNDLLPVPDVVGISESSAESVIVAAGFVVGTITREYSETINEGNVISQYTRVDELLPPGGAINIIVSLGLPPEPVKEIVFIQINEPYGFEGKMSKYEITNSQYCHFLNAAKADGLITVCKNNVYAASDTSHSRIYLKLHPDLSSSGQIVYNTSTFRVRTRDGYYMGNHPVTEVGWYGVNTFCNYYGYRLPTEDEWLAVADFDGSYIYYGCGTTIDHSKANYDKDNPLGLSWPYTTPAGYYPNYGYGISDMSGNVMEYTSTYSSLGGPIILGGSWYKNDEWCRSCRLINNIPDTFTNSWVGFRPCR